MNIENIANRKEASRFMLRGGKTEQKKAKAIQMMNELNTLEEPYERDGKKYKIVQRMGITTERQLIIDIDNHDEANLAGVEGSLQFCFPGEEYLKIKTLNGCQIIFKSAEKFSFKYKHLKVLNVTLDRNHDAIFQFEKDLTTFLEKFRKKYPKPPKGLFNIQLRASGLINPVGDIDYLYNVLAVVVGHSTIRISPKKEGDKWEVIS